MGHQTRQFFLLVLLPLVGSHVGHSCSLEWCGERELRVPSSLLVSSCQLQEPLFKVDVLNRKLDALQRECLKTASSGRPSCWNGTSCACGDCDSLLRCCLHSQRCTTGLLRSTAGVQFHRALSILTATVTQCRSRLQAALISGMSPQDRELGERVLGEARLYLSSSPRIMVSPHTKNRLLHQMRQRLQPVIVGPPSAEGEKPLIVYSQRGKDLLRLLQMLQPQKKKENLLDGEVGIPYVLHEKLWQEGKPLDIDEDERPQRVFPTFAPPPLSTPLPTPLPTLSPPVTSPSPPLSTRFPMKSMNWKKRATRRPQLRLIATPHLSLSPSLGSSQSNEKPPLFHVKIRRIEKQKPTKEEMGEVHLEGLMDKMKEFDDLIKSHRVDVRRAPQRGMAVTTPCDAEVDWCSLLSECLLDVTRLPQVPRQLDPRETLCLQKIALRSRRLASSLSSCVRGESCPAGDSLCASSPSLPSALHCPGLLDGCSAFARCCPQSAKCSRQAVLSASGDLLEQTCSSCPLPSPFLSLLRGS